MPSLFIFLLKVNAALLVFCAGYYLVLRPLTFYTLNRIYLVSAIVFATIYPKINLSAFVSHHQQIARPVQAIAFNWQVPVKAIATPASGPDYWYWAEVAFWAGAIVLAFRLLLQLVSLYRLSRNSTPAQIGNHSVRVMNGKAGPFSFWKSIYINPENHEPADLKAILLHEQIHVNEWHTLDILLAEISTVFYWFNPGVWLMKRAVRENIEFITDRKILKNGVDSKQYQYSLVSVSLGTSSNTLVNHFNISTIKKRIIMMNPKKSSRFKLTRYAFLVPAVVLLLLVFSISKAEFVTKSNKALKSLGTIIHNTGNVAVKITPGNSDVFTTSLRGTSPGNKTFKAVALKAKGITIADTIAKGKVTIVSSMQSDSMTYVINGEKVKKADFKALDPDNIYSIELLSGENAQQLLGQLDGSHSVLFVTTKDSERGKKFKEKIDNLNDDNYMIAGRKRAYSVSSFNNAPVTVTGKQYKSGNGAYTLRSDIRPRAMKKAQNEASGDGRIEVSDDDAPVVYQYDKGQDSLVEVITANGGKTVNIRGMKYRSELLKRKATTTIAYSLTGKTYSADRAYIDDSNSETNINHLSAKLFMIDGKEAIERDLKKISAADIESMSVKSGEEIRKKYGDKAKDGVVFIVTKKGK